MTAKYLDLIGHLQANNIKFSKGTVGSLLKDINN
jgi:hypothetical protein